MPEEVLPGDEAPKGFKEIPDSPHFFALKRKLVLNELANREDIAPGSEPFSVLVIRGFEDVLGGERLGGGRFHNTFGNVIQLLQVLNLSKHPLIRNLKETDKVSGTEFVRTMREAQVLKGVKIVDLGAGGAYFARAVQALGATVVTVDAEGKEFPGIAHVQTDLSRTTDAVEKILAVSDGKFDMIVEHIISPLPYQQIHGPSRDAIVAIAQKILKRGGYLSSHLASVRRNKVYRKR